MRPKLLALIISIILISSCHKEEKIYSCNSQIDAIVKSGQINFSEISLKDFLEYDLELQKAIYRSFSATKKYAFWMEKLDYITNNPSFTQDEINHVNKLKTLISTSFFSLDISEINQDIALNEFIKSWISYSIENLKWDEKKFILLHLLYVVLKYNI